MKCCNSFFAASFIKYNYPAQWLCTKMNLLMIFVIYYLYNITRKHLCLHRRDPGIPMNVEKESDGKQSPVKEEALIKYL